MTDGVVTVTSRPTRCTARSCARSVAFSWIALTPSDQSEHSFFTENTPLYIRCSETLCEARHALFTFTG